MTNRNASVRAAVRTHDRLGDLFAKLGTREHPRGAVLVAYRNARRAMRDVLRRNSPTVMLEAREVMIGLQYSVRATANRTLNAAITLGMKQAAVEAATWNLDVTALVIDTVSMIDAWTGTVEQQERAILATLATGADPALILGSDTTIGLLNANISLHEGTRWLATAAGLALLGALSPAMRASGQVWGKQAIACIDGRTTECCLRVHGQIVAQDEKFRTTGSPAFAERQDWPPFHWNCRTSGTLVPLNEADDDLTAMLREQSSTERGTRRETAERVAKVQQALIDKSAMPDGRRRKDDTAAVTKLREELLKLRRPY